MTQILLVRHAVNDFVKTGRLAGWTPEVHLNDEGKAQAEALGVRLADAPIKVIYASPLERTMETAEAIQRSEGTLLHRDIAGEAAFAIDVHGGGAGFDEIAGAGEGAEDAEVI